MQGKFEMFLFDCFSFFPFNASQIRTSSLCRSHANNLCIIPIVVYVLPKPARLLFFFSGKEEVESLVGRGGVASLRTEGRL